MNHDLIGHVALVGIAVGMFATTNLDDLFILLGFFSDPKFRPRPGRQSHEIRFDIRGLYGQDMVDRCAATPASATSATARQHVGDAFDQARRSVLAAATMLASAGMTSPHWRVLSPQSGFTHRRSAGTRSAAFLISCTMCSCEGMLGEWMS